MSEFECRNGHLVAPSKAIHGCPECGEPIVRMDGKSSRQLEAEEREWERSREEGEEEKDGLPD